jgi:hypothetical protein
MPMPRICLKQRKSLRIDDRKFVVEEQSFHDAFQESFLSPSALSPAAEGEELPLIDGRLGIEYQYVFGPARNAPH